MRWYLEKVSNPAEHWDARFDGSVVTLTTGDSDGALTTEEHEFDSFEAAVGAMREQVGPLFAAGFEQRVPPDERYAPDPRIAEFWQGELIAEWEAFGVARRDEPSDYRDLWASYIATDLPPELDQYLRWRSEYAFGYCNYGEWRIWDADLWLPRPEDGNLFEQLVLSDQENYLGTAMLEHFAGLVYVGSAGNGDGYYAHPNHADPAQAEVLFFDHETFSLDFAIADSLSSLAWLNHCYCVLEDGEEFDHDAFVADFALLENRARLSWHYEDLSAEAEIEPGYEDKSRGRFQFYRAIWLDHLLRPSRADVDQIGNLFYADIHTPLRFEDALRGPYLAKSPVTALYWLWRLWWFARPELRECLDVVATHPSPIVRDCAALISELEAGRKTLGAIEDMHARREAFLALDLDPDRAEARAAEQATAAREAELALASRLDTAHRLIAEADEAEIREAMWELNTDAEVMDVLYEHLAAVDPGVGPWLARWAFLRDGGASRDNRYFSFEVAEVRESLRRGGAVLAPLLARPGQVADLPLAAVHAPDRTRPRLEEALAATDKYRRGVMAAAEGFAVIGATDVVPRLVELLDELSWDAGDYIAAIERKDVVLAVIEALGKLGGAAARDALVEVLGGDLDALKPRALVSLGRVGDPEAVADVVGFVESPFSRPALFALAWIGSPDARAAIASHLETVGGSETSLAYEHAMRQYANRAADEAVDWPLVERLTRVVEALKFEDREMHETLARLLAAHPDRATAVRLLTDYIHHEHAQVRDAALHSLEALGACPPLRWLDRPTVDALFAAKGLAGLREALTDPHAVFRHNVLRKAVDEGVARELSAEACALAEFYCRFTHYTHGYVRDAHEATHYLIEALAAVGSDEADRLLCRFWKGTNPLYREADTLKYDREEIQSRLQRYVAEVEADLSKQAIAPMPVYHATTFSEPPWVFGACINGMAWAPNGEVLAVCGEGGVHLYDRAGATVRRLPDAAGGWIYDVDFSPDGALLAVGAHGGHLLLVDPAAGKLVRKLHGHGGVPDGVRKVRFSPSGALLASASNDRTMRVWDVASGECIMVWEDPADVNTVDWVDEETLVIGTDRMIRLIDVDGTERVAESIGGVAEVRVDRERERIYVGSQKKLRVYDLGLAEKVKEGFAQAAVARVRRRGNALIAASWEGNRQGVVRWTLKPKKQTYLADGREETFALDLHPQTGEIFAGGRAGRVARWSADGTDAAPTRVTHVGEVRAIRFAGDEILTAASDGRVIRWASDGTVRGEVSSPGGRLCDAAVDPVSGRLYVTGPSFTACFEQGGDLVWSATPGRSEYLALGADAVVVASNSGLCWFDRSTGALLHETEAFADSFIFHCARLDDRRIAVAGYDDERLFVWDIETRERVATWELPSTAERGRVRALAVASERVYVSRWNGTLLALDAQTGDVRKRVNLEGSRSPIAVSPDGRRLCLHGGAVTVVDSKTFDDIATIDAGSGIETMAFAPDGRLFFGTKAGGLRVLSGLS